MKNTKKILAVLAVILLLAAFCLPMFFAFGKGEGSRSAFMAALGVAVFVPVFAYICMMAVRIFGKKKEKQTEGIRNIVFDAGNVLVDYDWQSYLKSFSFPEEEYERIADITFRSPEWNERDRGVLSEEEIVERFAAAAPEYEDDIRKVMSRTYDSVHPLDYADTWVRYLKNQGYHLYLLSNFCDYMLKVNRPQMTFLKYMDGVIFSCEVKLIKPEREIYELFLQRYQLNPGECVFLDDREENCEGARQAGMKAICFKNLKQAAGELEALGVK